MPSSKENISGKKIKESNKRVISVIYKAIDEINSMLPSEKKVKKEIETKLFVSSSEGSLDSLGLLNLIVAAEQEIEKEYGCAVDLARELIKNQDKNPFLSVETLANYIEETLSKKT